MRDDHFTCWTHHNISFRFRVRALLTRESVFFLKIFAWPCQLLKALARFTLESLSSHASRACWIKTFRIGQVLEKKTCNSFKTDKTPRTGEFSISPDKLICKLCQQFNRDGKNKKNTFLFGEGSDTACVLFEIHMLFPSNNIHSDNQTPAPPR